MVVYVGFVGSCQCFSSLSSKFPKLFPMFVQSSLFFFLWLLFRLLCILINSRDIHGRWVFALVLQCGMVLFISVVRLSRKKVQFVLTSCEFGSESKYSSVSLEISILSLHQSADLYLNTL